MKILIMIISFLVLILVAFLGYKYLIAKYDNILDNDKSTDQTKTLAKDFIVYDDNNKEVKLSDFKGKPVVINFWASWCIYCTEEMPDFHEVYLEEKENIVFMMVNATDGSGETKETAKEYMEEEGYEFNIYYDINLLAINTYNITGYPTTVFVDKDGYITKTHIGKITKNTLLKEIEKLK